MSNRSPIQSEENAGGCQTLDVILTSSSGPLTSKGRRRGERKIENHLIFADIAHGFPNFALLGRPVLFERNGLFVETCDFEIGLSDLGLAIVQQGAQAKVLNDSRRTDAEMMGNSRKHEEPKSEDRDPGAIRSPLDSAKK